MYHSTKSSLLALSEVASDLLGKGGEDLLHRLNKACVHMCLRTRTHMSNISNSQVKRLLLISLPIFTEVEEQQLTYSLHHCYCYHVSVYNVQAEARQCSSIGGGKSERIQA